MKKFILALIIFIGFCFLKNAFSQENNYDLKEMIKRAESGSMIDQMELGYKYGNGDGIEKNNEKSFYYYAKCSLLGDYACARSTARMLYLGEGVKENKQKAFDIFYILAKGGDVKSQIMVSSMYAIGDTIKKDLDLAKFWAEKACKNDSLSGCELYEKLK